MLVIAEGKGGAEDFFFNLSSPFAFGCIFLAGGVLGVLGIGVHLLSYCILAQW